MSKIALAKVMRDFVDSALLPLFRLREPEKAALEIERSALSAQRFLTANFDQPIHALHSLPVKPFTVNEANRVPNAPSHCFCVSVHIAARNGTAALPVQRGSSQRNIKQTSSISDRGPERYSRRSDLNSCGAKKCGNL
nr:hypothetical protein [Bradyrhizobium zhanjiangense]